MNGKFKLNKANLWGLGKSKLKRREKVLESLGGICEGCGTKHRLHLHHIYYSKDSARWVEGKPDPYNAREKEAQLHPERFKLFCPTCHGDFHKDLRIKKRIWDGLDPLSIIQPAKYRVLTPCKICTWPYFPDEIKKHEETCDGKTPLDRKRNN